MRWRYATHSGTCAQKGCEQSIFVGDLAFGQKDAMYARSCGHADARAVEAVGYGYVWPPRAFEGVTEARRDDA